MNTFPRVPRQGEHQSVAEDGLLRASEVQRELGISRATAYRMMTDGTLPAYRFSGRRGRRTMVRVPIGISTSGGRPTRPSPLNDTA